MACYTATDDWSNVDDSEGQILSCYFVQAWCKENVILVTFPVKLDVENEKEVRVEESKVFRLGNWEE